MKSTVIISNLSSSLIISRRNISIRIIFVDCRNACIASSCVAERKLIELTSRI